MRLVRAILKVAHLGRMSFPRHTRCVVAARGVADILTVRSSNRHPPVFLSLARARVRAAAHLHLKESITLNTRTTLSTPPTLDWREADDDVFVATSAGEYAGFIGITPLGYEAHSARGEYLGMHASRDIARAAVAASATASSAPRTTPPRSVRPLHARVSANSAPAQRDRKRGGRQRRGASSDSRHVAAKPAALALVG